MNYLNYFFSPTHLFSLRPPALHNRAMLILALVFGALLLAGLAIKFMLPKVKDALKIKGWRRLIHLCLTLGLLGFVYLFFGWQGVALLSSRFWLLVLLAVFLVWLFFIAKYFFLTVPKLRKEIDRKKKFSQYLP